MNDIQRNMLGDCMIGFLPYYFKDAITNHCNYDYSKEKIDVNTSSIGSLGKFWKFVNNFKSFQVNDELITLQLNKDENENCLILYSYGLENAEVKYKDGTIKTINLEKSIFKKGKVGFVDFNIENPIKSIKLNYWLEMCEAVEIKINIIPYKYPEIDYNKIRLEKLNVKHTTGESLINIYFNLCDANVEKTKINIYLKEDNSSYKESNFRLITQYEETKETFFKSITGLAYGVYFYEVLQFGKNEELLVKTEKIEAQIKKPIYNDRIVTMIS